MELLILDNGKLDSISLDELKKAMGIDGSTPPVVDNKPPVIEPAKPFGYPRTLVGTTKVNLNVLSLTGVPYLALLIKENPDTIAFRGTNLEYIQWPGTTKPVGADSEWYGNSQPKGAKQPDGYRTLYFDNDPKQPYYEQISTATMPIIQTDHITLTKNGSSGN